MTQAPSRRLLTWMAMPLLVAQVGCATRAIQVPSSRLDAMGSGDRKACEEFARSAAAAVKGPLAAGQAAVVFIEGFAYFPFGFLIAPVGAIWAGTETAVKNAKNRRSTYERAMTDCLEQNRRPQPPDVAERQTVEPLDEQAIAISDKTLAPGRASEEGRCLPCGP